ncbi:MAG: 5'/3'-nucleotidase SurE [Deltaproteobacteria bacterium]|nr:5'/3'-nucleotidase SurE [Deltaproteobacteria bacterium]
MGFRGSLVQIQSLRIIPKGDAVSQKTILVTNDDGVHSRGLTALREALAPLGRVVVVAPDRERSAIGHAITLDRPLRVVKVETDVYAIDGTPTDCVFVGLHKLLDARPAVVASGINLGINMGNDVTYSGTVGGAMEGTLWGIPSIAVSQDMKGMRTFDDAVAASRALAAQVITHGLPDGVLLNMNVPAHVRGRDWRVTTLGRRHYGNEVDVRKDPRGREYFWIGGVAEAARDIPDSDGNALRDGVISVSPVSLDMTAHGFMDELKAWANGKPQSPVKRFVRS